VWAETTFQISTRGRHQIALIFVSALQVKISQIRRRCVWARNYVGHYHTVRITVGERSIAFKITVRYCKSESVTCSIFGATLSALYLCLIQLYDNSNILLRLLT
jgi:hypothetical protein